MYWRGRLWVSHVEEDIADYFAFFAIEKKCSQFCLCSGCYNPFEHIAQSEDGSIEPDGFLSSGTHPKK